MRKLLSGLFFAGMIGATSSAQALVIDDFGDLNPSGIEINSANPSNSSSIPYSAAFGGSRHLTLSAANSIPQGNEASVNVLGGYFILSNDQGISVISTLDWNSSAVDLTEGLTDNQFIFFDIFFLDINAGLDLILTVFDSFGSDDVELLNFGINNSVIPFSAFTGVDFTQVNKILVEFKTDEDVDFVLDGIRTSGREKVSSVPEPETLVLLLAGMMISAFGYRKRES